MSEKYMYFNEMRFTRDNKTGYYLSSRKTKGDTRQRMHVYVWERYNGAVPDGCHVHHIDGDKSNNDIENLQMLEGSTHLSFHGTANAALRHDEMAENLRRNAVPKAREWHCTEEGKMWHKMHYARMKDKLHVEQTSACLNCGKEYKSVQAASKFCSNSCKSAWRRKSGVDNVEVACKGCGREFTVNKYAKKKYCSKECACKSTPRAGQIH